MSGLQTMNPCYDSKDFGGSKDWRSSVLPTAGSAGSSPGNQQGKERSSTEPFLEVKRMGSSKLQKCKLRFSGNPSHPFDDQAADFMSFNAICAALDLDRRLIRGFVLKEFNTRAPRCPARRRSTARRPELRRVH